MSVKKKFHIRVGTYAVIQIAFVILWAFGLIKFWHIFIPIMIIYGIGLIALIVFLFDSYVLNGNKGADI